MCDQCEVLNINGINCHETGCPDAWKDAVWNCKWCGSTFQPEDQGQQFCDESCAVSYHGWDAVEAEWDDDDQEEEEPGQ